MKTRILKLAYFLLLASFLSSCSMSFKEVENSYKIGSDNNAIIYGKSIQYIGFGSGGTQQFVQLRNVNTQEIKNLIVKSTWTTSKENYFCVLVPNGYWELLFYFYSDGFNLTTHYLIKANDIKELEDFLKGSDKESIQNYKYPKYGFQIESGTINYLGTWDLKPRLPEFRDDFEKDFSILQKKCKWATKADSKLIPQ